MELIRKYPFLEDYLIENYSELKLLKNKVLRNTMARKATLGKVSGMININIEELVSLIAKKIHDETGEKIDTSEAGGEYEDESIRKLKEIIKEMHKTGDKEKAKEKFNNLLSTVDAEQIVAMEQLLIQEGTDVLEIQKLCDVHLEIMHGGLSKDALKDIPEGHPVDIYIKENAEIMKRTNDLNRKISALGDKPEDKTLNELKKTIDEFSAIENHYTRKENQLFPYLEKKGVTGPSQVMWAIHDEIRKDIKTIRNLADENKTEELRSISSEMVRKIIEMVRKEELILFPMALEALTPEEWCDVKKGEHEIGFSFISNIPEWTPEGLDGKGEDFQTTGQINLTTGSLNSDELNRILLALPVDISYVDENDNVKYYTGGEERIFPRSPGVIGRNVENCHPPASVDKVRQILDAFKRGEKDVAEFWIELHGKFLHIRYFALRDDNGKYMGTLEFMQDATHIRNLKGERRLLDWN